jgi:hypothetical protein
MFRGGGALVMIAGALGSRSFRPLGLSCTRDCTRTILM